MAKKVEPVWAEDCDLCEECIDNDACTEHEEGDEICSGCLATSMCICYPSDNLYDFEVEQSLFERYDF